MMRLYHYTPMFHLPEILDSGTLRVTESNVDMYVPHAGPDVVWLTTDADLFRKGALWSGRDKLPADKLEVRFTVRVPDAVQWERWQRKQKVKRQWYATLVRTGGDHLSWYVVEHSISRSHWDEVRVMSANAIVETSLYMPGSTSVPVRML